MGTTTSFIRGHIGAAIASGVAVVALAGGGIAYAVTASGSPAPASASRPSASTPATTAPHGASGASGAGGAGHARAKHPGVRGTVAAVNGGTWTVKITKGATISVTVNPQTAFGTKKAPATASSFPVGTLVRVEGQRAGTSITAARIVAPKPSSGATTSTTVPS